MNKQSLVKEINQILKNAGCKKLYLTEGIDTAISNENLNAKTKLERNLNAFEESIKKGGKLVYEDENWKVLIPKTFKSNIAFSQVTKWYTNFSIKEYHDDYKSLYFINLNMKTGDLYQFYFEFYRFINENNERIDLSNLFKDDIKLREFYIKYLIKSKNHLNEYRLREIDDLSYNINFPVYIRLALEIYRYGIDKFISRYYNRQVPDEAIILAMEYSSSIFEDLIEAGFKPSVKVQQAAIKYSKNNILPIIYRFKNKIGKMMQRSIVKNDGGAIGYLIYSGIKPSEEVQKLAVQQDGYAIKYIIKAGIKPSEEIQRLAVEGNPELINNDYINSHLSPEIINYGKELLKRRK